VFSILGADVNAVCRDASMMSMRSVIPKLSQEEIKNLKAEDLGKCFLYIYLISKKKWKVVGFFGVKSNFSGLFLYQ
jgi:SpoVK/Ycf46/Vps4 family AAA+-type ATPase